MLDGRKRDLARLDGEVGWHSHPEADQLSLFCGGDVTIERRDAPDVDLSAGELVVVPAGIEHHP